MSQNTVQVQVLIQEVNISVRVHGVRILVECVNVHVGAGALRSVQRRANDRSASSADYHYDPKSRM